MKPRIILLSLCTLLAIVFGATGPAAATSPGDSTNGHGTFTTGGTTYRFVFDAKEKGDATITGRARIFDDSAISLDIVVDCLTISGNTAIVGGTLSSDPTSSFAFKVTDNGGGATADRITLPQTGQTCATFNTLSSFALTSGDVEVHDQP